MHATTDHHQPDDRDPRTYWEQRYAEKPRIWSGRPNLVLTQVAANLTPGRALDLGCGEGADAIWLAEQGWAVVGLDISATALARARSEATSRSLDESRARFCESDLAELPAGPFDLVTASFLHSPVTLERSDVLRRAAGIVGLGGHLLITTHAAPPPWAQPHHTREHRFFTADEEIAQLGLADADWITELSEVRERAAMSPDGEPAALQDGVVLLRRRSD